MNSSPLTFGEVGILVGIIVLLSKEIIVFLRRQRQGDQYEQSNKAVDMALMAHDIGEIKELQTRTRNDIHGFRDTLQAILLRQGKSEWRLDKLEERHGQTE